MMRPFVIRPSRAFLLATSILCSAPGAAVAETLDIEQMPLFLLERLRAGTFDDFLQPLLKEVRRSDQDHDGLEAEDLAIAGQIEAAQYRAHVITQVASLDLDGDGSVTTGEATRAVNYQYARDSGEENQAAQQKQVARALERIMAYDGNGDGVVTLTEAMSAQPQEKQRNRRRENAESLLALDPNQDGRLAEAEVEQVARQAFDAADYDRDGALSNNEVKLLASARDVQRLVEQAMPCDLPKPASDDLVAVLGTYAGAWQPTVTVAGQDETTHLAIIDVEPGTRPVYVVLNSYYPMIWQFSGATGRLAHVVAVRRDKGEKSPETAGAGIIGVGADKVTFLAPGSCGRAGYEPDSKEAKVTARAIQKVIGRAPDAMLGAYSPKMIAVPSGQESEKVGDKDLVIVTGGGNDKVILDDNSKVKVIAGNGRGKSQEDWLADPATLLTIDPATVLAPGKVETYEVLPRQYGLRQLVEEGKLERTKDGYRIVQPIKRFPTGLAGAHSVIFYLPEGTPMPEGDLGHSQLILEKKKAP